MKLWLKLKGSVKSWTAHFNVWCGVILLNLPMAAQHFPELQPYLPADWYRYGIMFLMVGNYLLRFKTNVALEQK